MVQVAFFLLILSSRKHISKYLFYQEVSHHIVQEMNHATHNRVLLGHLGVKLHLVQLLVVEEYDN